MHLSLGLLGLPHCMATGIQGQASQDSGSGCSQFLKVQPRNGHCLVPPRSVRQEVMEPRFRGGNIDVTSRWQECQRILGSHVKNYHTYHLPSAPLQTLTPEGDVPECLREEVGNHVRSYLACIWQGCSLRSPRGLSLLTALILCPRLLARFSCEHGVGTLRSKQSSL